MKNIYDSRRQLKYVFIIVAILIAIVSVFASNSLIQKLAEEEQEKVKIWAEDCAHRCVVHRERNTKIKV